MKKILLGLSVIIIAAIISILLYFKSDSKNPYQEVQWGKFTGNCKSEEIPNKKYGKNFASCDYSVPNNEIPTFKDISLPFNNSFNNKESLPFMASAMIDIDNDGIDEVFFSGGTTKKDGLFKYSKSGFKDISNILPKRPKNTATLGASSFDLDKDGLTDLILTGDYGIYWYKNTGDAFEAKKIDISLTDKSTTFTTTIADYNKDGHADIFLCTYIRLDKMEGQTIFKDFNYGSSSLLLQNNGDNTFTDVTEKAGLSYVHNTFQAIFVDIDNDGFLDLIVAYDTGEAKTYKNIDGNSFKQIDNPLTKKYAYPMGIAAGDYNNDGLMDFFFSNTGSSIPTFLARGDLDEQDEFIGEWILFRNDGDFQFTDVAKEAKIADFEFSWGAIFQDFNLDGKQDLIVAENYIDFPPHKLFKLPCRFLLQREGGTFAAVEDQAGAINKAFAITPLTSDFNQDGYPDLIYTNLNGPMKALINNGGDHNYIGVRFPENADYSGARVIIKLNDESILSDSYMIGEGLASDQTSTLTFGLGNKKSIKSMEIYFPSGKTKHIESPSINQTHFIQK